jgi:flagellar assembly protein FliH
MMASSSDWIAQMGEAPLASPASSGWIAALAGDGADGFCEVPPFVKAFSHGDAALSDIERVKDVPSVQAGPGPDQDEDAETKAYSRGYNDGFEEAKRVTEADIATEQARLRDLRLAFRALDAAAVDALAQDLSATVQALCEPVLREYGGDAEALKTRCLEAARRLGAGPTGLTLHLNPESRALLDEQAFEGWTLVDDPGLEKGALRLCGEDAIVRDGPADWSRAIAEAIGG